MTKRWDDLRDKWFYYMAGDSSLTCTGSIPKPDNRPSTLSARDQANKSLLLRVARELSMHDVVEEYCLLGIAPLAPS